MMIYPHHTPRQYVFLGPGKPGPVPQETRNQAAHILLCLHSTALEVACRKDLLGSKCWFLREFGAAGLIVWEKLTK
jgi:hypothetical protein